MNEKNLISTEYSCGNAHISISFSDEPATNYTEQIRSILLTSYSIGQDDDDSANYTIDKTQAA